MSPEEKQSFFLQPIYLVKHNFRKLVFSKVDVSMFYMNNIDWITWNKACNKLNYTMYAGLPRKGYDRTISEQEEADLEGFLEFLFNGKTDKQFKDFL